jgi:hypothetical protein
MLNHWLRKVMKNQVPMAMILLEAKPYWKFRPAGQEYPKTYRLKILQSGQKSKYNLNIILTVAFI